MLNHETIQRALSDRNLSKIARILNLSIHTLVKLRDGKFENLRASSVETVSNYLQSTGVTND